VTIIKPQRAFATLVAALLALSCLAFLVRAQPVEAAFPGTNGVIAYENTGDIWLTDSRGVDAFHVNLTNSPVALDINPSVSPDGTRVAFQSTRGGSDFEIYTLHIYTGALRQVTNNSVVDGDPAWSPNGTRLAYVSPTNASGRTDMDIWIKNADGTGTATNLSSVGGMSTTDDLAPSWSPNGNEIAFHTIPYYDIVGTTLSGADRVIGSEISPSSQYLNPNWSPNGARITYQYSDGTNDYEIYTLRASDGLDRRQLTSNSSEDEYPAYSPNGTQIAFSSNRAVDYSLFTMSSSDDGTSADERLLDGSPGSQLAPDWGATAPPASPGCTMSGTFAADSIFGTAGNDTICALGGNDHVAAYTGDDTLKGGGGNDRLSGYTGRDRHFGGGGGDTLDSRDGLNGNDSLNGGPGRDRCLKDRSEASVRSCP
jgi:hypothetical protein